jgi:Flp pilus assembly protein TadG
MSGIACKREMQMGFFSNQTGGVGVLFGIAALPIIGLVGAAVDYSSASAERAKLRKIADAAALAGAQAGRHSADSAVAAARAFFEGNVRPQSASAAYSYSNGIMTVTAEGALDTAFLSLLQIKSIPISIISKATAAHGGIELVLVLDVSGSMKGSGKIEALREAAVNLVDKIYGEAEEKTNTWVGIVPFSGRVNIVDYENGWMLAGGNIGSVLNTSGNGKGKGKGKGKGQDGNSNTTDDALLCTGRRSDTNDENDATPATEKFPPYTGPENSCPGPAALALQAQKTPVRNALLALYTGQGTSTHIGMAWGYRMISPRWKGLWGNGALPLDYSSTPGKVVIIMTDGENHPSQAGESISTAEADEQLVRTCNLMKKDGITIYAVTFMMKGALVSLYERCASRREFVFDAESAADLIRAFDTIGEMVTSSNLRLIQ